MERRNFALVTFVYYDIQTISGISHRASLRSSEVAACSSIRLVLVTRRKCGGIEIRFDVTITSRREKMNGTSGNHSNHACCLIYHPAQFHVRNGHNNISQNSYAKWRAHIVITLRISRKLVRAIKLSLRDVYVISFILKNILISRAFVISNNRRTHYAVFTVSDIAILRKAISRTRCNMRTLFGKKDKKKGNMRRSKL